MCTWLLRKEFPAVKMIFSISFKHLEKKRLTSKRDNSCFGIFYLSQVIFEVFLIIRDDRLLSYGAL